MSSSSASHFSKGTSVIFVPHHGTEMLEKALNKAVEFARALEAKEMIELYRQVIRSALSATNNLPLKTQKQNLSEF